MRDRSAPGWGALVGATWAMVVVTLLGVLGLAPPDRLVLFGVLALGVGAGSLAFTTRAALRSRRLAVLLTAASFLAGLALTGVPEYASGGQPSGPCTLLVAAADSSAPAPLDTSAHSPLRLNGAGELRWETSTPADATQWRRDVGLRVGGFDLVVMRDTQDTASVALNDSGSIDVEGLLADVSNSIGFAPTGTFHVFARIDAPNADCSLDAYVLVAPEHPWDGPMLLALWILALAIPLASTWLARQVRRGGATARRPRAPSGARSEG